MVLNLLNGLSGPVVVVSELDDLGVHPVGSQNWRLDTTSKR
jgi:hypothetical protein